MTTTPAAISPDTLRFVRCCSDLARAVAQRDAAASKLPTKERHAIETGNPAIAEVARETVAAWTLRVGELAVPISTALGLCSHCGAVVAPAAPAVPVAPVAPKAAPVRDCRVKAMRRFWAVAKSAGLNVRDAEAMTRALSKYLGCIIPSRACLSSGQWFEATAAVELGLLIW